ncbi:hypothetical protein H7H80_15295, partial [Mycobacterium interjectum]|nr:hypothetical protein [Mycobacterium interjectum]
MLGAIAIVPSAPVLVPELAGAAAAEVADLTAAVLAAASSPGWRSRHRPARPGLPES